MRKDYTELPGNGQSTFTIRNDEGIEVECEVLFTFDNNETKKSYIVYTDNTIDKDGKTKVYASTFDPSGKAPELLPIENASEWAVIENILEKLQNEIGEKLNQVDADPFLAWYEEIKKEVEQLSDKASNNGNSLDNISDKVVKRLSIAKSEQEKLCCVDILILAYKKTNSISLLCAELTQIGLNAYQDKDFIVAEYAFRELAYNGDITGKNNYAYMIRRGEVKEAKEHPYSEAISLLKDGVKKKEPFSLVNAALTFSLCLGAEDDWVFADQLISLVAPESVTSISSWWEGVANAGEVEGLLVHLWLIKHKKSASSPLGTAELLYGRIKHKIPSIPLWMNPSEK